MNKQRLFVASCVSLVTTSMVFSIRGDIEGAMEWLRKSLVKDPKLRRAQQALEQCQTETSLTRK